MTVPVELHPVPTEPMITPVQTRNIQVLAADTTPPFSFTLGKDVANQYETRPIRTLAPAIINGSLKSGASARTGRQCEAEKGHVKMGAGVWPVVAAADDLLLQGAATRRKAQPHGEVADLCRCDDLSALSTNAAAQYRLWQPHVELKNFIPIAVPIIA